MATTATYDGEVDVPEDAIQIIDENVLAKLPKGSTPKDISAHGASNWTRTARLHVELPDGSPKFYFLKVSSGDRGRGMMSGEFASMTAIHAITPSFAPIPIAWGTYVSNPSTHFFLCSFQDMSEELPDIPKFCARVAELHMKSISPNGQYGFHTTTYHGNLPQDNTGNDSWESFFAYSLERMLELEVKAQGPSDEIEKLSPPLFKNVIPRLLRPLETGGRQIKPCLVHGDLWYGNASIDINTDEPMVYDACCFYAHNEYELGSWRPARNKFGKEFNEAYHKHFPIAAPEEDYDDRVGLYSV